MKRTDFQCLATLHSPKRAELSRQEVYKACVATANNGLRLGDEAVLRSHEKTLLDARRLMKSNELAAAESLLRAMASDPQNALSRGDQVFLLANIRHVQGEQRAASDLMKEAARIYSKGYEDHRALRATINGLICVSDLDMCTAGALVSLEQEARRGGYHDLVAHIQRARSLELMRLGRVGEAVSQARFAVASYEQEGCPEDKAVAISIAAIGLALSGDLDGVADLRNQILISDGKVAPYIAALDAILQGRPAEPPQGHPLQGIGRSIAGIKPSSILGKIVGRLRQGPATRDELIAAVWGASAIHPSYQHRLHSALHTLKNTSSHRVRYDGNSYIIST